MKRTCLIVAGLSLALAAPASAKGPTQATITGPGLDMPLIFKSKGDWATGTPFSALIDGVGFFPSVFPQYPNPMLPARPRGDLGPRYTIRYGVPNGTNQSSSLRQHLYPYAVGGAVSYMPKGQGIFDQATTGGWFRAPASFRHTLISMGLPRNAPTVSRGGPRAAWMLAPLAALLLAAMPLVTRRRRT
jgi:hypothetical protein